MAIGINSSYNKETSNEGEESKGTVYSCKSSWTNDQKEPNWKTREIKQPLTKAQKQQLLQEKLKKRDKYNPKTDILVEEEFEPDDLI